MAGKSWSVDWLIGWLVGDWLAGFFGTKIAPHSAAVRQHFL
jgi:hypothetical protein